jgi:short-subunit dehydrogenase
MHVVITGASKGFGKEIAMKFAEAGASLYLCSRTEAALKETSAFIQKEFPQSKIQHAPFDLSLKSEAQEFGKWVLKFTRSVDVLVNNAGQFSPGSVYNEPEGTLEQMIDVNLYSAYHLTRTLLPGMMKKRQGHIFNICSIASFQAYDNGGAYSISKFALAGFSKNLREEMKPYNIKVTSIYPGAAYTDSWAASGVDPQRLMEASDVAAMIYSSSQLSSRACVEDIIMRPQAGDL